MRIRLRECLCDFLPPSPPTEKASARQEQARQSSTDDGAGDCYARERKGRVERWRRGAVNEVGAHPHPVRLQSCIAYPALKIGEAGREGRSGWHDGPRCREPKKIPRI